MKIRHLVEKDMLGHQETLQSLYPGMELSEEGWRRTLAQICENERHLVLVAELGTHIVGTITLIFEPKFSRGGSYVAHIGDVAVHSGYLKRGIYKDLIKHAVEHARSYKCYEVILECRDENIPDCEKLGFRRHENKLRMEL